MNILLIMEIMFGEANIQSYVWRTSVGKYLETHVSMDKSVEIIIGDGVTGPIVWTWQLQDPIHKEEQKTCLSLSMD